MKTHMIHCPIDMGRLGRWAANRGLGSRKSSDMGYVLHILLTGMFGRKGLQPFRLRLPRSRGRVNACGLTS